MLSDHRERASTIQLEKPHSCVPAAHPCLQCLPLASLSPNSGILRNVPLRFFGRGLASLRFVPWVSEANIERRRCFALFLFFGGASPSLAGYDASSPPGTSPLFGLEQGTSPPSLSWSGGGARPWQTSARHRSVMAAVQPCVGAEQPQQQEVASPPSCSFTKHHEQADAKRGVWIRRFATRPAKRQQPDIEWRALVETSSSLLNEKKMTWVELQELDAHRRKLLMLARETSPIDSLGKLWLLPRTVIPRILKRVVTWLVLSFFAAGAMLSRLGFIDAEAAADISGTLEGISTVVTFMIIFYVSYCYSRYEAQYEDAHRVQEAVVDACLSARVCFSDSDEVHRLWRYLNLLHVSAYCGLTTDLTEENFLRPFAEEHGLFAEEGSATRRLELAALSKIDVDSSGSRACSMFEVWSFEVIRGEAIRGVNGSLPPPIAARQMEDVSRAGKSIKRLFAYRFQVLPFIYTQLVSLSAAVYLSFSAFIRGLSFLPGSPAGLSLVLPLLSTLTLTLAVFGLLVVGDTILDPFGDDHEDFAVLHFVSTTCAASWEAIQIDAAPIRAKEQAADFYDPVELNAGRKVMEKLVRRYRWRKIIEAARERRRAMQREVHEAQQTPEGCALVERRDQAIKLGATPRGLRDDEAASALPPPTRNAGAFRQKLRPGKSPGSGGAGGARGAALPCCSKDAPGRAFTRPLARSPTLPTPAAPGPGPGPGVVVTPTGSSTGSNTSSATSLHA
jgi:hypothetical protein